MTQPGTKVRRRTIPSLCLHKATGQAVVRLGGKDFYCGLHGTPEADEKYRRLVAEWLPTGQQTPPTSATSPTPSPDLTVNALLLAYWKGHVATSYVKKGRSEQDNIR